MQSTTNRGMNREQIDNIAVRFKSARALVKMTRKKFCEKYDFSVNTLQAWEMGKNISSKKMLMKFCEALAKEGIFCTPEWLMEGSGQPPKTVSLGVSLEKLRNGTLFGSLPIEEKLAKAEAEFFVANQKTEGRETLVFRLGDDSMAPLYQKSDWVAGSVSADSMELIGKVCIVEMRPGEHLVRTLMFDGSRFVLVPKDTSEPLVSLEKFERAAAVTWHRKLMKI